MAFDNRTENWNGKTRFRPPVSDLRPFKDRPSGTTVRRPDSDECRVLRLSAVSALRSGINLWPCVRVRAERRSQSRRQGPTVGNTGKDTAKKAEELTDTAKAPRPGRQSRMRLARDPGRQSALARRPRYRVPASRSLRPLWLPWRPHPGDVPLRGPAGQHRTRKAGNLGSASTPAGSTRPPPAPPAAAQTHRPRPEHQPSNCVIFLQTGLTAFKTPWAVRLTDRASRLSTIY